MKKCVLFIIFILLLTTGLLSAEIKATGIGISAYISSVSENDSITVEDELNIYIKPNVALMLNENSEINIFVSYYRELYNTDGYTTDIKTTIGGGAGLYYHFINGKVVSLSTGADLGVSFGFDPDYFSYKILRSV